MDCQELTKNIQLDGIADGLIVVGKGVESEEMVTTDGKITVKECEMHHTPGLPIDLVPPQKLMKPVNDGQFKINGEKVLLGFSDDSPVSAPFNPEARLPMFCSNCEK